MSSSLASATSTLTAMPSVSGRAISGRTSVSTVNSRSWPSSSGTAVTSTSGCPMARMPSESMAWPKKRGRASLTASWTTAPRPTRWSMIRLGTWPLRKPGTWICPAMVLYAASRSGLSSSKGTSTMELDPGRAEGLDGTLHFRHSELAVEVGLGVAAARAPDGGGPGATGIPRGQAGTARRRDVPHMLAAGPSPSRIPWPAPAPAGGGAGDGNRTRMASLEGWGSAIELHPRTRAAPAVAGGVESRR